MKGKETWNEDVQIYPEYQEKKPSSEIYALAALETYTEQLELQKFCQDFHLILYLVVWLDKFNYNCLAKQLLQPFQ